MSKNKQHIIAFHPDNQQVANEIREELAKAGYLVEAKPLSDKISSPLRQSVTSPSGAILLLLTDNFLKSEQCMNGALEALRHWADNGQLVPIVADGRQPKADGTGWELAPTQFERVSNIIHYMNHWQDKYLTLRKDVRNQDDAKLEAQIEITKNVAGEVGEFLRYLRNLRWYSLADFKASNYFAFRQFTDDVPPQTEPTPPQPEASTTQPQEPRQRTLAEIIQDSGDELMAENTDIGQPKKKKAPEEAPVVDLNDIPGLSLLEDLDLDAEAAASDKKSKPENEDGAEFSSILSEVLGEDDAEEFKFVGEDPDNPDDFDLESLFEEDEEPKSSPQPAHVEEDEVSLELVSDEDEGLVLRADGNGHATPEEVLEHAVLLFDDGKMAEGLDFLRKTVLLNASDNTMRYYYAYALARYGKDFDAATDQLEVILASDQEHTDALFLLGELCESDGDYEEAKHYFETVAALQPDFPEIYYRLGMLTLQHFEGEENLAFEFFKKSVEFSPKHADGHYILATLYNEIAGDPVNAIRHFNQALRYAPNHSYANYDLARLHLQHGDRELASEHYKSAVKLNPELKSAENDAAFLAAKPTYEVEIIPSEKTEAQPIEETIEELMENAAAAEDITEPTPAAPEEDELLDEVIENIAAAETLVEAPAEAASPEEIADAVEEAIEQLTEEMPAEESPQVTATAEAEPIAEQKSGAQIEIKTGPEPSAKNFTSKLEQILDQEEEMDEDEFVLPLSDEKTSVETKTVLITGATSGIGRATAELFARNGYRVIATGRRAERLDELAHFFKEKYQTEVLTLPFDVRNLAAVKSAIENMPEEWQEVDILINNAGLSRGLDPIHEGKIEDWETMIDTNIKGLLYLTRAIAPQMVKRRSGHIINVASSAGKEVYPGGNVYCATKFAVDALTKAMRVDLFTHNVRVSQVAPGHVEETEFARVRFDWDNERAAKVYENFQPLKASDVADVIYFIATRPVHVNVQDVLLFGTQQAGSTFIDRSGRAE